ncbi:MAG: protein-export chaperone SecB [Ignavibacteria bacterium]
MDEPKTFQMNNHPIQLKSLNVKELSITTMSFPDDIPEYETIDYEIGIGVSHFDKKSSFIKVGMSLRIGCEDNPITYPFKIKVELIGLFFVDQLNFDFNNVEDWANKSAPFILFPYLREHVYTLSVRAGIKPIILPLIEVPVFKLNKQV